MLNKNTLKNCIQIIKNETLAYKEKKESIKEEIKINDKNQHFISLIQRAKLDLEQSKNFFANVTDPDLVDYAAHKILANQFFYNYLLKKAKKENIKAKL